MNNYLIPALAAGALIFLLAANSPHEANTEHLQSVARTYAHERNTVTAMGEWRRFEFINTYLDPIVVVENADKYTLTGIRNVDETGFESRIFNCASPDDVRILKDVIYSVIEKEGLPVSEEFNAAIKQQFTWGECE